MKPKKHFEICGEMAARNMEIVGCTSMTRGHAGKKQGTITIGVPQPLIGQVLLKPQNYIIQLLIINADQYEKIKNDK